MKQATAIFFAFILAFSAGWLVKGWHQDSLELVALKTANEVNNASLKAQQDLASQSARTLENKLEELANVQPPEIRTEIIKPVFTNLCVSDDFVRMYNEAIDSAERTLSGKSTDKMPDDITKVKR
ncbi:TPA: hypothetical protein U2R10_001117 [Proteus mirabilis]|uniref:hypothetical protein n=1 Tax=Proteus mirabilis TaxID=584 RepID=UPI0010700A2D|nr:hypothetical protein [Proteus mirabilis]KAB7729771.1 hypothetical protein GBN10_02225 [Proteus mirabilis]MBG2753200.1 hypothetical protein [Proteus mirabilis]MBG2840945.1 hypothetical protein [Proteus mirabilis]MBG2909365.1 hypothetical protein [Proteus mirabilis]MBG3030464.1 hypothetical protein [Proteus mirabilis]